MFKISISKLEFLASIFHNIITKKNIILILGNKGHYLAAINNNKIISELYIPQEEQENLNLYQYFFNKFKTYNIFLLLDDNITINQNELIPIINSVVKKGPVESFIKEHFAPDEIVAYHVYDITTNKGEIWNTLISHISITPLISNLIDYILSHSLKFGGIYFLALEFVSIIDNILIKINKDELYQSYLQILVIITESCEVKLVVKYYSNIINIHTFEYPVGKSSEYLQGLIEQQISDCLLKLKDYIQQKNLKICLIFFATNELKEKLVQSNFAPADVVFVTNQQLISDAQDENIVFDTEFADNSLCLMFADHKSFIGFNPSLKSLTQLNLINSLLFKLLSLVIIGLGVTLGSMKFNSWQKNIETLNLNKQYYIIAEEYRKLKNRYPTIQNVTNLADLYSLETLLKIPFPMPFDLLGNFINLVRPTDKLQKISWKLLHLDEFTINANNIEFNAIIDYVSANKSLNDATNETNQYIKYLQSNFTNYKQIMKIGENKQMTPKITLPISIFMTQDIK